MANTNKDTKGADKAAGSTKSAAEQEAEQKAAAQHMQARAKAEKAAKEAAEKAAGAKEWTVAPGKSITTARGVVGGGEVITAHDLKGRHGSIEDGEKSLKSHHEKGYVLHKGKPFEAPDQS